VNDRIERETTINAPIERVWAVLTEPDLLSQWFSTGKPAEVDLRPGGVIRLNHGEGFDYPTRIVRVEPPTHLSYRWASAFPGDDATVDNSTLVEFTLEPVADGTRLRVVETGFAALDIPAGMESRAGYESHTQGWPEVLDALRKVVEHLPV
jgi:uncharacterized protein YndB with AHSA1/START domain